MKAVLEEYGILIVELICAVAVVGVFLLVLDRMELLAGFVADKVLGGAP